MLAGWVGLLFGCLVGQTWVGETVLAGRVLDADGPVAGARVTAVPDVVALQTLGLRRLVEGLTPATVQHLPVEGLPSTRTDADGRFALSVPRARVVFDAVFSIAGDAPDPVLVVQAEGREIGQRRCVRVGVGAYDAGTLTLHAGARLKGALRGTDGRPLAGERVRAVVDARDRSGGPWVRPAFLWATTDERGRFLLDHLPAGEPVGVAADVDGHLVLTTEPHELAPGETHDVGELRLSAGERITGRVVDGARQPVADARIVATGERLRRLDREHDLARDVHWVTRPWVVSRTGRSDAEGRFAVDGLPAGEAHVWVEADGFEYGQASGTTDGGPFVVELRRESRLVLRAVAEETGVPLASAELVVHRLTGRSLEDDVEPLAQAPTIVEGAPAVVVRRLGTFGTAVLASAPGRASQAFFIDGLAPGERRAIILPLAAEAIVSGRVLDQDGRPVPGARVVAQEQGGLAHSPAMDDIPSWRVHTEGPVWHEALSDASGDYTLRGLQPGSWQVTVSGDELASWWREGGVQLEAGEVRSDVDFDVVVGGRVAGWVEVDGERQPFLGVAAASGGHRPVRDITDHEGRFVIEGVLAGDGVVTSALGGEVEVQVTARQMTPVHLALTREQVAAHEDAVARAEAAAREADERRRADWEARQRAEREALAARLDFQATFAFDEQLPPSFEPFLGGPMVALLIGEGFADLHVERRLAWVRSQVEGWEQLEGAEAGDPPQQGDAGAMRRIWLWSLPAVLRAVSISPDVTRWDAAEVELARWAAAYLDRAPDLETPAIDFAARADRKNAAALGELFEWYREVVRRPLVYAEMIVTMDDGPYAPEPVEGIGEALQALETAAVHEGTELRLCPPVAADGDVLLQCVRDGLPLWTVALPHTSRSLGFTTGVEPLGPYGWRVEMSFGERVHAYLDAELRPLFYYVSW